MRVAILFSGGKDSTLAVYEVLQAGYDVKYLISVFPRSRESYMFHYPNIELTGQQAKSMGIPIITRTTEGEKERELHDLEEALKPIKDKIDCVISGAVASEYQLSRVDKICKKLNLKSFAPLWHKDPLDLWRMCLDNGFKIMITAVACEGLDKSWLGKIINEDNFKELKHLSEKYRFHLSGEGGEFETLVVDCSLFRKALKVEKTRIEWDEKTNSGFLIIEEIA